METNGAGDFLRALTNVAVSPSERALAVLWWYGLEDPSAAKSARELATEIEAAGFGQQNVSRLTTSLEKDARTGKTRDGKFRILATARRTLDDAYLPLLETQPIRRSNTVLPLELVVGTRQYIERVVLQLNASYD